MLNATAMKIIILTVLALLCSGTAMGQCSVSFTAINSIWCDCTGYLSANTVGVPPYNYIWSTGETTDHIDSLCPGTYTVTVADGSGCVASNSTTITSAQFPVTFFLTYTPASCGVCCDAVINATVTGGCAPYTYYWTPSGPICPGITYTLIVTDNCGCTATDSITPDTIAVGLTEHYMQNNLTCRVSNRTLLFSLPATDLKIFDVPGNLVFSYSGREIIKTDLPDLKTGLYIIKAQAKTGQVLTGKIIVLKE